MTEQTNQARVEESRNHQEEQCSNQHDAEIPAIRHVGPTLESAETIEDQQLADTVNFLRDIEGGTSIYEPQPDSPRVKDRNEPLRTRLPGDTSSEPHTDVGPDNATNVQNRGE